MRAIVTAGGTQIPIDDVRVLTNKSKGLFLWAIASALAKRGVEVTVIGSELLYERVRASIPEGVTFRPFVTYDDLTRELSAAIDEAAPDLLFMGAAVSDYGLSAQAEGKIASDKETLTLTLVRLPKILAGLRARCGKKTFLVGFKLTSRATDEEMLAAARKQLKECRLNMVVANDAARIGKGKHPVTLATAEGGAIPIPGDKEPVADVIVDFSLRRARTTWYESRPHIFDLDTEAMRRDRSAAETLLRFAQETHLLSGSEGNISTRSGLGNGLWITPRGAERKATIGPERLVYALADPETRTVRFQSQGTDKSSIDTSVHARLYRELPHIEAMLHTHFAWFIPDRLTSFPYPCGSAEEAEEILHTIDPTSHAGFGITLVHHGQLIGLEHGGMLRLRREWSEVVSAYRAHLEEVGQEEAENQLTFHPVFAGAKIVGLAAEHTDGWYAFFLHPQHRKGGLGGRLLSLAKERGAVIGAHENCAVAGYYLERGFCIRERRPNGLLILELETPKTV